MSELRDFGRIIPKHEFHLSECPRVALFWEETEDPGRGMDNDVISLEGTRHLDSEAKCFLNPSAIGFIMLRWEHCGGVLTMNVFVVTDTSEK